MHAHHVHGFVSQLPYSLIQSFTMLEDVIHLDVILHLRDMSYSNMEQQRPESCLHCSCGVDKILLTSMLEVHNKMDLVRRYNFPGPCILAVSALLGHGLDKLKEMLEESVLQATGCLHHPLPITTHHADISTLPRMHHGGLSATGSTRRPRCSRCRSCPRMTPLT